MANIKSKKKNIRKIEKQNIKNRAIKSRVATAIKRLKHSIDEKNNDVLDRLSKVKSEIGNAVSKGVLHKNNGSRKTSRVEQFVNKNKFE